MRIVTDTSAPLITSSSSFGVNVAHPSAAPAFEMTDLGTDVLQFWARTAAGYAAGVWTDQSGNGNDSATFGSAPGTGTLLGKSCLTFDGITQAIQRTSFVGGAIAQTIVIMMVCQQTDALSNDVFWDGGDMWSCFAWFSGGNIQATSDGLGNTVSAAGDMTTAGLLEAKYAGASSTILKNGSAFASGNAGVVGMNGYTFGKIIFGSNPLDGKIGEVVILNNPSAQNITDARADIMAYWGL